MYNIWQQEYEFAIKVKIPEYGSTAPFTEWLREHVGYENVDWAYTFVTASYQSVTYQFYFKDAAHMAFFKLSML